MAAVRGGVSVRGTHSLSLVRTETGNAAGDTHGWVNVHGGWQECPVPSGLHSDSAGDGRYRKGAHRCGRCGVDGCRGKQRHTTATETGGAAQADSAMTAGTVANSARAGDGAATAGAGPFAAATTGTGIDGASAMGARVSALRWTARRRRGPERPPRRRRAPRETAQQR